MNGKLAPHPICDEIPRRRYVKLPSLARRASVIRAVVGLFSILLLVPSPAMAQLGVAQLHSIFPAGGRSGTTFEVEVTGGEHLFELDQILFSQSGIRGVVKTEMIAGRLRPLFGTFVVTIDADVPPGLCDVRVSGLYGTSTPRTFAVSRLTEIIETEPNNSFEKANEVKIGSVINGRSDVEADLDFYRFQGRVGSRFVIRGLARRIESRMQLVLALYDAQRNRLSLKQTDLRGDPVIDVTLPADGEYYLQVSDFGYAGGHTFGYRLAIDPGPHIDFIIPPAGQAGSTGKYTLFGRNLPGGKPTDIVFGNGHLDSLEVDITLPNGGDQLEPAENLSAVEASIDGVPYHLPTPNGPTEPVMIYFASQSLEREVEPNDTPAQAQTITVPGEYAGQFQQPNDIDVFNFTAKAKEVFTIEVFAQRYGNTTDAHFVIEQLTRTADGKEQTKVIAEADDNAKANVYPGVFDTLTDDPITRFVAPVDGLYRLTLSDRYAGARGDPSLVYRLSIRREAPDFRLVVLPIYQESLNPIRTLPLCIRRGENVAVKVMAFRTDGFNEPIEVRVEGLPPGVTSRGVTIAPNKTFENLILSGDDSVKNGSGKITVVGEAKRVGSEPIQHIAREAVTKWDDTTEQRVTRGMILSTIDETPPQSLSFGESEFKVKRNGEIQVPLIYNVRWTKYSVIALDAGFNPSDFRLINAPFSTTKVDAKGECRDFARFQVNSPPGEYHVHLSSALFLSYRSSDRATERLKILEDEAKRELTESAALLKQAESTKDATALEVARQRKLEADALQRYFERNRKQIATFATMSQFGGRYYHVSPAIKVTVE